MLVLELELVLSEDDGAGGVGTLVAVVMPIDDKTVASVLVVDMLLVLPVLVLTGVAVPSVLELVTEKEVEGVVAFVELTTLEPVEPTEVIFTDKAVVYVDKLLVSPIVGVVGLVAVVGPVCNPALDCVALLSWVVVRVVEALLCAVLTTLGEDVVELLLCTIVLGLEVKGVVDDDWALVRGVNTLLSASVVALDALVDASLDVVDVRELPPEIVVGL